MQCSINIVMFKCIMALEKLLSSTYIIYSSLHKKIALCQIDKQLT